MSQPFLFHVSLITTTSHCCTMESRAEQHRVEHQSKHPTGVPSLLILSKTASMTVRVSACGISCLRAWACQKNETMCFSSATGHAEHLAVSGSRSWRYQSQLGWLWRGKEGLYLIHLRLLWLLLHPNLLWLHLP